MTYSPAPLNLLNAVVLNTIQNSNSYDSKTSCVETPTNENDKCRLPYVCNIWPQVTYCNIIKL